MASSTRSSMVSPIPKMSQQQSQAPAALASRTARISPSDRVSCKWREKSPNGLQIVVDRAQAPREEKRDLFGGESPQADAGFKPHIGPDPRDRIPHPLQLPAVLHRKPRGDDGELPFPLPPDIPGGRHVRFLIEAWIVSIEASDREDSKQNAQSSEQRPDLALTMEQSLT